MKIVVYNRAISGEVRAGTVCRLIQDGDVEPIQFFGSLSGPANGATFGTADVAG